MKFLERFKGKQEKPPFIYSGTVTPGIKEFEPRERHTPAAGMGPLVYATALPAFAAAHGFSWSSDEGFELYVQKGEKIVFVVPEKFKERLQVPIYIYKLPSDTFEFEARERTGHTLTSAQKVRPVSVEKFNSVIEAIEHFGGEITYKE